MSGAGPAAPARRVDDQVYSRAGGVDRLADVYLPEGEGPFPAVLFLHGGGWRFGDRRLAPDLARFFARRGYVAVSIDYRLSDEAVFPAGVSDVVTAIRWMKAHASDYRIDPARIGLLGSSAGAHLAMLAGLAPEQFASEEWQDQDGRVAAIVDGYGPVDFLAADAQKAAEPLPGTDPESAMLPPPMPATDPESMESRFLGAPVSEVPEKVAAANPVTYAEGASCPILILHGDCDAHVPPGQSRLLFEALSAKGAEATLTQIGGLGHGFLNRNDLDDGGPRDVVVTTCDSPGEALRDKRLIWEEIHAFLKRSLR